MHLHVCLDLFVEVKHQVVVYHRVFKCAEALRELLREDRLAWDLVSDTDPIMLILAHLLDQIIHLLLQVCFLFVCCIILASFIVDHVLKLV